MDKRDEKIERSIEDMISGNIPSDEPIEGAVRYLRTQNQKKNKRIKPFFRRAATFLAAAAMLTLVIFGAVQLGSLVLGGTKYYSLSQLGKRSITGLEAGEITNGLGISAEVFPDLGAEKESYTLFYFRSGGRPAFIMYTARILSAESIDEITIVAEFDKAVLDEFKKSEKYNRKDYGGTQVGIYAAYEGGEYVTNAALKHNKIKYYLKVMNPVNASDNSDFYIRELLSL